MKKNMDLETQTLINAFKADQADALASDATKIKENAADEVKKKIEASDLAQELKQPLSDYVKAQLTKSDS